MKAGDIFFARFSHSIGFVWLREPGISTPLKKDPSLGMPILAYAWSSDRVLTPQTRTASGFHSFN